MTTGRRAHETALETAREEPLLLAMPGARIAVAAADRASARRSGRCDTTARAASQAICTASFAGSQRSSESRNAIQVAVARGNAGVARGRDAATAGWRTMRDPAGAPARAPPRRHRPSRRSSRRRRPRGAKSRNVCARTERDGLDDHRRPVAHRDHDRHRRHGGQRARGAAPASPPTRRASRPRSSSTPPRRRRRSPPRTARPAASLAASACSAFVCAARDSACRSWSRARAPESRARPGSRAADAPPPRARAGRRRSARRRRARRGCRGSSRPAAATPRAPSATPWRSRSRAGRRARAGRRSPKKFSCCVRPGVELVRARPRRPTIRLIADDLPTLERPANATSGNDGAGNRPGSDAAPTNVAVVTFTAASRRRSGGRRAAVRPGAEPPRGDRYDARRPAPECPSSRPRSGCRTTP